MHGIPVTMRTLALGAALSVSMAWQATAQQREVFEWSGPVDREVQITMRGRSLSTSNVGNNEPGRARSTVTSMLPRQDGEITIQVLSGRGTVDVIQQPTSANNYTAVVRIRDGESGAARYRFNALWQPSSAGEVGPPYGRGRGRGRDRDRVYNPNNDVYAGTGNRSALVWSGEVDDNLNIRVRPTGVEYSTLSGKVPRAVSSNFRGLPQTNARLAITNLSGRGDVTIIQQPTSANGYTAVIRVRDPQPGYGSYSFSLIW